MPGQLDELGAGSPTIFRPLRLAMTRRRFRVGAVRVYGIVVELVGGVRPRRGSKAWLMATVRSHRADNAVLFTFGKEPRGFVMPWASGSVPIAGLNVSTLQILIPVIGLALAAGLHLFSTKTRWGRAMLAVVQNPDAARLMGINVPLAISAA